MPLTIFYNIISGNRSHVKIIGSCDGNFMADFGRLAGRGTHEELLQTCEVYREIYESQFKKEDAR